MTVVCGGGDSEAKAGVPAAVVIDQAYMQSILPQPWSFLYPYLPYMHVLEIGDVATFCTLDPPTYSFPNSEDFLSFITGGNIGHGLAVKSFFENLVKSYLWYSLCKCSTGSPTAHPAADSDPGDLPLINPPAVVSLPATYCLDGGQGAGFALDPTGVIASTAFQAAGTIDLSQVNSQTLILNYTRNTVGGGPHQSSTFEPVFGHGLGASFSPAVIKSEISVASGSTFQQIFPIPPDIHAFKVNMYSPATSSDTYSVHYQVVCDVPPGSTPTQACCPPDTIATGMLSRLLSMVELIQRQSVPFAYVPGATHAGLADNGSLTIADLIGVKIEVTTLPASYGRQSGDPIEFFGLGFLTWGTTDGYRASTRLEHEFQVIFPPLAGVYTALGYSLAPGVVVTVTELVREP